MSDHDDARRDDAYERIEAERERAATRATMLERELADIVASAEVANVDDEHDPEGATIAFERAQVTELLRDARRALDELAAARDRLDAGTYGRCEGCGRPIGVERLEARPAVRHCIACAGRDTGTEAGRR